jgi:hypothetical protein
MGRGAKREGEPRLRECTVGGEYPTRALDVDDSVRGAERSAPTYERSSPREENGR